MPGSYGIAAKLQCSPLERSWRAHQKSAAGASRAQHASEFCDNQPGAACEARRAPHRCCDPTATLHIGHCRTYSTRAATQTRSCIHARTFVDPCTHRGRPM
eukprot:312118-Prymnesium_polylepis.1